MKLADLKPESDQETTFLTGILLITLGFSVAQALGSILFLPLALIVPGSILILVSLRPPPGEEPPP